MRLRQCPLLTPSSEQVTPGLAFQAGFTGGFIAKAKARAEAATAKAGAPSFTRYNDDGTCTGKLGGEHKVILVSCTAVSKLRAALEQTELVDFRDQRTMVRGAYTPHITIHEWDDRVHLLAKPVEGGRLVLRRLAPGKKEDLRMDVTTSCCGAYYRGKAVCAPVRQPRALSSSPRREYVSLEAMYCQPRSDSPYVRRWARRIKDAPHQACMHPVANADYGCETTPVTCQYTIFLECSERV